MIGISPALASQIVEAVNLPMVVLDEAMTVVAANGAFSRAYCLDADALSGGFPGAFDSSPDGRLRALVAPLFDENSRLDAVEAELDFPAVGRRIVLLSGARLEIGPADSPCAVLTVEDVTERRRARRELVRENQNISTFVELSLSLMNRLEPEDLLSAVVVRAAALMDTEHAFIDLIEPDQLAMVENRSLGFFESYVYGTTYGEGLAGRVWQTGEMIVLDDYASWPFRAPIPDFDRVHGAVAVPLKSGGEVLAVLGLAYLDTGRRFEPDDVALLARFAELASVALDNARLFAAAQDELAERKRVEENLRYAEQVYRDLFNSIDDTIFVHDLNANILDVNDAACRRLGYAREDLLRMKTTDLEPPEYAGKFQERLRTQLAERHLSDIECMQVRRDGRRIPVDVNTTVINYRGQEAVLAVYRDIGERKRAEIQALELATQRENVRVLADFIRDTSHDLRTPLSIINANLYLLGRADQTGEQRERTQSIKEEVNYLNHLIEQLHAMSILDRMDDLPLERVDLARVADDIFRDMCREHGAKQQTFSLDVEPGLPWVEGNATQLDRALTNIVENAILYTPAGGQIDVRIYRVGPLCVAFEVADNGVGIQEADLPRIFDRFFKVNRARTKDRSGTGLGLAMTQKIIALHHGTIEVDSQVNHGTTFRVLLAVRSGQA